MDKIVKHARAKINLCLDVTGVRENGYHDVRMVMQTVGLWDEVVLTATQGGIELECDEKRLSTDMQNIAYRAAALFIEEKKVAGGVRISLKKRIPMAAGLAGGSTDAAAVLSGLNELYECGCSTEELMRMGVKLGADVPYCVLGGTCLAEGIGEELTPLSPCPECYIVLAKPPIDVSTKYVYEHLDKKVFGKNADSGVSFHPQVDLMLDAINLGDLELTVKYMGNILALVTESEYPVIEELRREMLSYGAMNAMMSGSGPTVFGIFRQQKDADYAAEQLRKNPDYGAVFSVPVSNDRSASIGE